MSMFTFFGVDEAEGGPAGPNLYETLFTDLSVASGFVLHGTLSSFYEDSAGTTEASASGTSPLGRITDVSGLSNHAIQNTTGNKPVFYSAGGVKSFRSGTFPAGVTDHFLRQTTPTGVSAAFTHIFVGRMHITVGDPPQNWGISMSNFDGGWGAGAYVRHGAKNTGEIYTLASTGVSELNASPGIGDIGVNPHIVVIRRAGTGSNQTSIKVYDLDGTLVASATGTQDGTSGDGLIIGGYNGVGADGMRFAFMLYANGVDIGSDNEDAVVDDLVSTFGSWAG